VAILCLERCYPPFEPQISLSCLKGGDAVFPESAMQISGFSLSRDLTLVERIAAAEGGDEPFSVSRILCKARVGRGGEALFALFRHMAPLTVNAITRALPIESRVNIQSQAMVCLFTSVRVGVEKPRTRYARSEVAFLPSGALICVFARDVESERPLNPIGRVEKGIELFDRISTGDVIRLALVPPA